MDRKWLVLSVSMLIAITIHISNSACGGDLEDLTEIQTPWVSDPPFKLPDFQEPSFPNRTFNIKAYGAVEGGESKTTEAIAKAIAACAESGGGHVLVPEGVWLTGAVHLQSNVDLHLEKGATLRFSTDPNDYLPPVFVRWAGFECYNYSPLIYARDCENIAVTGEGNLDGQGADWWEWLEHQDRVAAKIYDMVLANVPVKERVFGNEQDPLRPQFIQPINCKNVLIEGISLNSGPFWTVQAVYCDNFIARGVKIENHGPNNDGINIDSTRNALIEDCYFATGDDCVALKSGLNEDGWRIGRPTENVVMRDCHMKKGHGGICIGSDMSGGVRNVFVHDCLFEETEHGVRLKSARGRGGVVENIWIRDIRMGNIIDKAIRLNTFYKAWFGSASGKAPTFRQVHIKNITCESANHAIEIRGLPERYIEDVTLENIRIHADNGVSLTNARGIRFQNVEISSEEGAAFRVKDCENVILESVFRPNEESELLTVEGNGSRNIRLLEANP